MGEEDRSMGGTSLPEGCAARRLSNRALAGRISPFAASRSSHAHAHLRRLARPWATCANAASRSSSPLAPSPPRPAGAQAATPVESAGSVGGLEFARPHPPGYWSSPAWSLGLPRRRPDLGDPRASAWGRGRRSRVDLMLADAIALDLPARGVGREMRVVGGGRAWGPGERERRLRGENNE
jgi:hypothetical protein